MSPNTVRTCTLVLVVVALGGCAYKPQSDGILMRATPIQSVPPASALVTDGGFCVTLDARDRLITQPCDRSARQQFSWDAGALQLLQRCLVAREEGELAMVECEDESRQWQWQADRLLNRQIGLCLDVAGRRHQPGTPLRLAECYGGANQSFAWQPEGRVMTLDLKSLVR